MFLDTMQGMGAKRTVEYPPWVEEWRAPGRYVRKTPTGYALYTCETIRTSGEKAKTRYIYLGRITEEAGFIPKEGLSPEAEYQEYGLSHFIWTNLRMDIRKHLPSGKYSSAIKLGIIQYVFGSVDEVFLRNSYLTCNELDSLVPLARKISQNQIQKVVTALEQELEKKIPMEEDREHLTQLLRLCVSHKGHPCKGAPGILEEARELLEKYGLKM